MTDKPKVALCGWYGHKNYGDDLLQRKLTEVLSEKYDVDVYSDIKSDSTLIASSGFLHKYYKIFIGGGGIVNPAFWLFKYFKEELLSAEKPITFLNVNLDQNIIGEDKDFTVFLKALGARWIVRDSYSGYLVQENITDNVCLIPDIALTENNINLKVPKKLTVCLNYYAFGDFFKDHGKSSTYAELRLRELSSYLDWMTNWGWKIYLLGSQFSTQVDDHLIHTLLYGFSSKRNHYTLVPRGTTDEEYKEHISTAELCVSNRYHSCMTCISSNTNFIDINFHKKTEVTLQDLNLQDHIIYMPNLYKETLIDKTIYVEKKTLNFQKIIKSSFSLWDTVSPTL